MTVFVCFSIRAENSVDPRQTPAEEKKVGCFAIIVLHMQCYYKCSVAIPHDTVGWFAVCDCGIS